MDMVRITLTDNTTREMTRDEMINLSVTKILEITEGKCIIKTEFYNKEDI